jgi:hypothetical protein
MPLTLFTFPFSSATAKKIVTALGSAFTKDSVFKTSHRVISKADNATATNSDHAYIIESDDSVTEVARTDVVTAQDGLSSTYQVSVLKDDHLVTALSVSADGFAVAGTNLTEAGVSFNTDSQAYYLGTSKKWRILLDSSGDLAFQSKDGSGNYVTRNLMSDL